MDHLEPDEQRGATLGERLLDALREAGSDPEHKSATPERDVAYEGPGSPRLSTDAYAGSLEEAVRKPQSTSDTPLAGLVSEVAEIAEAHWAHDVCGGDCRFESRIIPVGQTVASYADELLNADALEFELLNLVELASILRSTHEAIVVQSLESQLAGLVEAASGQAGDRLQALLGRFGWLASDQLTLEQAGATIGVTRERVRQIEAKTRRAIANGMWLPKLDQALRLLEQSAPLTLEDAAALLIDAGVTEQLLSLAAIDRVAHDLREQSPFDPDFLAHGVVSVNAPPVSLKQVTALASRRARASGVWTVTALCAELATVGAPFPIAELRTVLRNSNRIELLGGSAFWEPGVPKGRDRLENTLLRMLTVTPRLSVDSLLDGLDREARFRNSARRDFDRIRVPARVALVAYLEANAEFEVSNAGVNLRTPRPIDEVLGEWERVLVDILRQSPYGVLSLSDVADACRQRGMNRATTYLYIRHSPTLEEVNDDLFAIRGAGPPDQVAAQ